MSEDKRQAMIDAQADYFQDQYEKMYNYQIKRMKRKKAEKRDKNKGDDKPMGVGHS